MSTHDDFRTDDQMVKRGASFLHFLNRDGSAPLCGTEGFVTPSIEKVTCTSCAALARVQISSDKDMVNHPSHYGGGDNPYEVIKVLEAWGLEQDALLWNTVKYIARAGKKSPEKEIEDLEKAAFYLKRRIEKLKDERLPL